MSSKDKFSLTFISFRKGSVAQGVRAELSEQSIPAEILNLLAAKKKKTGN